MQDVATVGALAGMFQAACNAATSAAPASRLLPLQLRLQLDRSLDAPQLRLSGMLLRAAAPLRLTPLHRMRVMSCVLAASLAHQAASVTSEPATLRGLASGAAFRSGPLTLDQSRALVPLQSSDPLVRS